MAEIKSTLDLIMERTQNLTLTDAEKRDMETKERKDRFRGWCRRYLDGALSLDDLKENMAREKASSPEALSLLREECLAHVDPDKDNEKLFLLLQEALSIAVADLEGLIGAYEEELRQYRAAAGKEALEMLTAKGIGGSAVQPNPRLSPSWQAQADAARKKFRERLYLVK